MPNRYSIVGANHRKAETFLAELAEGATVTLVRDPLNPWDRNAIAVLVGDRHVGYVPKANNVTLAKFMDDNGDRTTGAFPSLIAMDAALPKDSLEERRTLTGRFVRSPNSKFPMVEV